MLAINILESQIIECFWGAGKPNGLNQIVNICQRLFVDEYIHFCQR